MSYCGVGCYRSVERYLIVENDENLKFGAFEKLEKMFFTFGAII